MPPSHWKKYRLPLALFGLASLTLIGVILPLPDTGRSPVLSPEPQSSPAALRPQAGAAQRAAAIHEAQAIQNELFEKQHLLTKLAVERWAASDFSRARGSARKGDHYYRLSQFEQAKKQMNTA